MSHALPLAAPPSSAAPQPSSSGDRSVVLVAEDEPAVCGLLSRVLRADGYDVHAAGDGEEAMRAFAAGSFDLVLSDIDLPLRNGIELLRGIRDHQPDVPVVLMTGRPGLDSAIAAVEHGASRYLTKPIDLAELRAVVAKALRQRALARARRALAELDVAIAGPDEGELGSRCDRALASLHLVFQPIVRWSTQTTFAFEALLRTGEPSLRHPDAVLEAAARLGRLPEVGRAVRRLCGAHLAMATTPELLFVNLHPSDLLDDDLHDPSSPLARYARRVVLEITERAHLSTVPDLVGTIAALRRMGYRIAIDDLGAGYSGLTSFVALEPELMKLDKELVRGLGSSPVKRRLVGAMIDASRDLGIEVVGECVEHASERDVLVDLGCDLLQGYLFGRPSAVWVPAQP